MCNAETNRGCVCEVVKVICHIQQNRERKDACLNSCDRPFLGEERCEEKPNTRPFVLYTREGSLWRAFFDDCGCVGRSSVFRVEKMDGCCATCRVLKTPRDFNNDDGVFNCDRFEPTDSFITIDLSCCCGIQCLRDVFLDCI
jgi:spore coat protein Z